MAGESINILEHFDLAGGLNVNGDMFFTLGFLNGFSLGHVSHVPALDAHLKPPVFIPVIKKVAVAAGAVPESVHFCLPGSGKIRAIPKQVQYLMSQVVGGNE